MEHDRASSRSRAAFEAKHNDVKKVLRELHVEVEMYRLASSDRSVWDKAATLAEVEQHLRLALETLREDMEETSGSGGD